MDSRFRGSKRIGRGRGMPHPAPPPWVPAFAGMTKLGGGMTMVVKGKRLEGVMDRMVLAWT